MQGSAQATATDVTGRTGTDRLKDYPVREYVSAMARELAHMARWDGDETLARALESAAQLADRPAA